MWLLIQQGRGVLGSKQNKRESEILAWFSPLFIPLLWEMVFNHPRTFLSHLEIHSYENVYTETNASVCEHRHLWMALWAYSAECWESNNEHFGVFAALLLTAGEAMQSTIQRFRAAPAVHARNSTGGNRVTHCVVLYCEKTLFVWWFCFEYKKD